MTASAIYSCTSCPRFVHFCFGHYSLNGLEPRSHFHSVSCAKTWLEARGWLGARARSPTYRLLMPANESRVHIVFTCVCLSLSVSKIPRENIPRTVGQIFKCRHLTSTMSIVCSRPKDSPTFSPAFYYVRGCQRTAARSIFCPM